MRCVFIFLLMFLSLASCSDDKNPIPTPPDTDQGSTEQPKFDDVECTVPVYVSPSISGDIATAIAKYFPLKVSADEANVLLFANSDLETSPEAIDDAFDADKLVVIVEPQEATFYKYATAYDHPKTMPTNIEDGLLLFAYSDRTSFSVQDSPDEIPESPEKEPEFTEEEFAALKPQPGEDSSYDDSATIMPDDITLLGMRMSGFINWLNDTYSANNMQMIASRSSDNYDPQAQISGYYYEYNHDFMVALTNRFIRQMALSDPDGLRKIGNIRFCYRIYPVFIYGTNNDSSAPGDYYIVDGTITCENGDVWDPDYHKHGLIKTYLIGYYMKHFHSDITLLDSNKNAISNLEFYARPNPETANPSTSYSCGHSFNLNFSLSGGGKWGSNNSEGNLGGSVGFGVSWTNSFTYNLEDVRTDLSTRNGTVSYDYTFQNFRHTTNYDDSKKGVGYPSLCRTDFSCRSTWIWKVPYNTCGAVENSDANFHIRVHIDPLYGVYSWFSTAGSSEEDDFRSPINYQYDQPIAAPVRIPFGVLALKNASSTTVANIKIWRQSDDENAPAYDSIPSSYNINEMAKIKLPEGTYRIKYDTFYANLGNMVEGSWRYDNIKIKLGLDENASTTEISTINAVKVR
ncbi:MAG: hypothetical protein ACI4BC_01965 [Muribaculaceae bacterium]